jgi:hypothetical protein
MLSLLVSGVYEQFAKRVAQRARYNESGDLACLESSVVVVEKMLTIATIGLVAELERNKVKR